MTQRRIRDYLVEMELLRAIKAPFDEIFGLSARHGIFNAGSCSSRSEDLFILL